MQIDLGNLIKEYRKSNNYTQQELADKLNISYQMLQKYEYNKCRPSLEVLVKTCNILEIPMEAVFYGMKSDKSSKGSDGMGISKKEHELIKVIRTDPELQKLIKLYLKFKDKFRTVKIYELINRILKVQV